MRAKPLSATDIGRVIDGRLSMRGFSRLKVANVKIKDGNVATADIVTTKGELVAKLTVNRQTGMSRIVD